MRESIFKQISIKNLEIYKFRIVKVKKLKPWQIQKRHKMFFWKTIGKGFDTFEEAHEEALKLKNNK